MTKSVTQPAFNKQVPPMKSARLTTVELEILSFLLFQAVKNQDIMSNIEGVFGDHWNVTALHSLRKYLLEQVKS